MSLYRIMSLSLCVTLFACAQQPAHEAPAADEAKKTQALPKVVVAQPERPKAALPEVELSEDLLYKLMLAEIALQRGQPHVAVAAYLELARETRDPRIAQRATEVAWNARLQSAALEAATLWLEFDPKSSQARQVIAALLARQEPLADAQPHLEKWLAADGANVGQSFLQLSTLLARHKDKPAVLKLMRGLAARYPEVPEARLAVAQAAWNAKDEPLSLEEARAALSLRPDWDIAALFVAQVLQRRSDEEAIRYLGEYLETHPKARDVRLNYARLLVNAKQYAQARRQFEVLVNEYPQNADVGMAVALLAVQANDYDAAEEQLKRVLELGSGGGNLASHLKQHVQLTLTDLSPGMQQVSRALNPECEHIVGDMRTLRLNRLFDAVLVHDAVHGGEPHAAARNEPSLQPAVEAVEDVGLVAFWNDGS